MQGGAIKKTRTGHTNEDANAATSLDSAHQLSASKTNKRVSNEANNGAVGGTGNATAAARVTATAKKAAAARPPATAKKVATARTAAAAARTSAAAAKAGVAAKTPASAAKAGVAARTPASAAKAGVAARTPASAAKAGATARTSAAVGNGKASVAGRTPASTGKAAATAAARATTAGKTVAGASRAPVRANNATATAPAPEKVSKPPVSARAPDTTNKTINRDSPAVPNHAETPQDAEKVSKAEISKLDSRKELFLAVTLSVFMVALFFVGRALYDDRYYTPDEGLGYWLGLTGGVMMLLGMAYTLFKYIGVLRSRAVMKHWLGIHIFLGIMGPVLITVHTTFHLGSINGGIAFITMMLAFISGIMGRYLYSKTHYGLGGRKAQVKDLHEMLKLAGHKIKSESLDRFTESVLTQKHTLGNAFWDLFTFGWRSRWLYFRLTENMRHLLNQLAQEKGWDRAIVLEKRREFKSQLRSYIVTLKQVALFKVYERFFNFWRNAHVPLVYLLLMSGIMHVIAVHMY